ncbi:MAG: DNA primase [Desulfobacteraceae bacterium]|nr:MAG: DNA primase [Desulfobacteraceae bacterium]
MILMDSYQSAKETLKNAVNIVDLIGQYVQLKKAGQNHIGLCPFHSEKDPSFTVNDAKQMFHCFGCKKGGDIFGFWMEYHKVSFPQALEDLAEKYHVPMPKGTFDPAEKKTKELKDILLQINETAAGYFHDILLNSNKGSPGRNYVAKRSIPKEIIMEFKLGYAPNAWDNLSGHFKAQDLAKAAEAGLIIPREKGRGYYDRFRGRVVFPIFNIKSQVIGFGARVLDHSLPKYLNSPETPIFQKGKTLYGLHKAVQKAREQQRLVIVEGYTDVLALRKHGFSEVVATLGTALTRDHIRLMKGYIKEALVVFDSDMAGRTATMKSLPLFLAEGLPAKVMILPDNDDPDTFVNKHGLAGFNALLDRAVPMFDFYLDLKVSKSGEMIENQIETLKEIIPILLSLDNAAQQSYYIRRVAAKIGVAEAGIIRELQKWNDPRNVGDKNKALRERLSSSHAIAGDDMPLLNLLIHHPGAIQDLIRCEVKTLLAHPFVIEIFDQMVDLYKEKRPFSAADILEKMETKPAGQYLREAMLAPSIYSETMVEQALKEFEDRVLKKNLNDSISKARQDGDLESLNRILKLKKVKGRPA